MPRLSDIVKMLQTTSSKGPMFICIDALDERVPENRAKLLDSLNKTGQESQRKNIGDWKPAHPTRDHEVPCWTSD